MKFLDLYGIMVTTKFIYINLHCCSHKIKQEKKNKSDQKSSKIRICAQIREIAASKMLLFV